MIILDVLNCWLRRLIGSLVGLARFLGIAWVRWLATVLSPTLTPSGTRQAQDAPPGQFRLALTTPTEIRWWKEVKLFDAGRTEVAWAECVDDTHSAQSDWLDPPTIASPVSLVFSKAKFAGVHTGVDEVPVMDASMLAGFTHTFAWTRD